MFHHDLSSYFQKNNKNKLYILALAFGLLLFLSGCKSAELQAMEKAASSIPQLTTGREVERYITDKGVTFGKPIDAEILIVYEPINNHTKKEVYGEIIAILKNNNWVGGEPNKGHDYFRATLQQGSFEITTEVTASKIQNNVTIYMAIH